MTKYRAKKTWYNGECFDSKKELERYFELQLLEKAGEITDLQRQVKFVLIPEQREQTTEFYTKGVNKGKPKAGKLIEKECSYIADFTYYDRGQYVVEDTKGFITKEFVLKRKMMLFFYGIRIKIS